MTKNQCWLGGRSATVLYYGGSLVQRMPLSPRESAARSRRRMALPKALKEFMEMPPYGHVAEWLRSGLQNRTIRLIYQGAFRKIAEIELF